MSGSDYERAFVGMLEDRGWLGVRSAGSLGKGDIVAIHPDREASPIVVEVKKSSKEPYRTTMNEKTKKQFDMMKEHARRGIHTIYAVRFLNGDKDTMWQIYEVTGDEDGYPIRRRGEGDNMNQYFTH